MIFDGDGPGTNIGGIIFFSFWIVFGALVLVDKIRGRK